MSIQNDIKAPFKSGNIVLQLVIVNVAIFLVINLFKIILFFSGYTGASLNLMFAQYIQYVAMPMKFDWFIYKPWTLFTYMFSHEGVGHIFWNMVSLYFFGSIIQSFIGNSRILALYIYGGIIGALLTLILHSTIPVLELRASALIGASGGIMAIVTGAATLVPEKRVMLFIFGEVKLVYIALFYLAIDLIGVQYSDGVGHICHIGGAVTGYFFMSALKSGNDWSKPFNKVFYGFTGLFKAKPKPKMKVVRTAPSEKQTTTTVKKDSASVQANIDKILDKISKGGYESLSKEEKDYLFRHGKDL